MEAELQYIIKPTIPVAVLFQMEWVDLRLAITIEMASIIMLYCCCTDWNECYFIWLIRNNRDKFDRLLSSSLSTETKKLSNISM